MSIISVIPFGYSHSVCVNTTIVQFKMNLPCVPLLFEEACQGMTWRYLHCLLLNSWPVYCSAGLINTFSLCQEEHAA